MRTDPLTRPLCMLKPHLSAAAGALALGAVVAIAPVCARAQAPEPAIAQLLAAADEAWKAGQYDDAYDRYRLVLRRDSSAARAAFRAATILAWRNDLDQSAALFRHYLQLAPADDDGRLGLARTLAWGGHYAGAIALTDSVLAAKPHHREATLLAAQVSAWSGNLTGAVARYQHWLSIYPNDADAWSGLAKTWQWAGRAENARDALRRAADADPANAEIRNELAVVNAAIAPSVEPTISSTDDSDENRTMTYALRGGWNAPWNARLVGDASYRVAELATLHGTSTTLRLATSWTPSDAQWQLRGELGAAELAANDGLGTPTVAHVEPIASLRLSGRVAPRLSLGASAARSAFDETAPLIYAGIATTSGGFDGDFALTPHVGLGGGGEWTSLTGGSGPNSRVAGSGVLRWSPQKFFSLAAAVRGLGYRHAATDGYFAPKRYLLGEVSSRLRLGGDVGWGTECEVGLGDQSITAFDDSHASRFAQRVTATLLYRPTPGVEWGLAGGFTNVASPTAISTADYRSYTIALKGRVRL